MSEINDDDELSEQFFDEYDSQYYRDKRNRLENE
jgi:hypothetical protein